MRGEHLNLCGNFRGGHKNDFDSSAGRIRKNKSHVVNCDLGSLLDAPYLQRLDQTDRVDIAAHQHIEPSPAYGSAGNVPPIGAEKGGAPSNEGRIRGAPCAVLRRRRLDIEQAKDFAAGQNRAKIQRHVIDQIVEQCLLSNRPNLATESATALVNHLPTITNQSHTN